MFHLGLPLALAAAAGLAKLRAWVESAADAGDVGDITYSIGPVSIRFLAEFRREHPDAIPATELHSTFVRRHGPSPSSKELADDIRRLSRANPGCEIMCCNFRQG
jgi:hypothetical protein